ncbi:1735_t:CDS:2 [Diversispora eburnea]|uniref:1735_t:CDS:1 n=1 Tax=Diversispora eburnea TaxID=1213867 RepID=A0A9N9GDE2_9GLOM|nr:1735_t:CDS:2 [Diversispora eburnea]
MSPKAFKTIEEELLYYKDKNSSLEEELLETQNELEEFQTSSREYEAELVKELEASEKHLAELRTKKEILKNEVEEWKAKYYQAKTEYNVTTTQMQRELDSLRSIEKQYIIKTRDLELYNDDLERNERAAISSLQDLENKYNKVIERNAILENELEARNNLIVQVQRLKDELQDVNIELAIMKNKEDGEFEQNLSVQSSVAQVQDSEVINSKAQKVSPSKREPLHIICPNSTRPIKSLKQQPVKPTKSGEPIDQAINKVKMAQDMSLEARLVSCRSLVTPLLAPPPSYSPPHSPKFAGQPQKRTSIKSRTPSLSKGKAFPMPPINYNRVGMMNVA